jgi:Domain of unknown function (DUF4350)
MKGRIIAFSAIGILLVLGVVWFLANHDRVMSQEWVGPSGEARRRDFLAAERFAERMGMKVAEVRSLPELDALPAQAALIVPHGRQQLPPSRVASLLQWVERGGHLIAEAEYPGVADPLLDQLGVKRSTVEAMKQPLAVEVPGAERKLSVFIPYGVRVEVEERDVRLRAGSSLVSFVRGRGLVTVASSLRFARNPSYDDYFFKLGKRPAASIGAHDHAELLWHVLSLSSGREASLAPRYELHVYFRPERLSFWTFLRDNAAPALIALAVLLALWIWSIVPRFGPVAPDVPPGRRRLLDHLRASGRYYWAKGLRSRLVVAARDAALRRLARAQPDFAGAPPAERAARLAVLIQSSKEDAAKFMSAAGAMRGADFIRVTQDAQRVHSALEKGSKK